MQKNETFRHEHLLKSYEFLIIPSTKNLLEIALRALEEYFLNSLIENNNSWKTSNY